MKIKIEFDTYTNSSFLEHGDSASEEAARVLRFIADKIENREFVTFNLIQKDHSYPIGMFSVEKS